MGLASNPLAIFGLGFAVGDIIHAGVARDVILTTGTPHGVGTFYNPPIFMKEGDVIEIEIEKIGILKNTVKAEK
ncbi:MAG: hypothetical protein EBX86_04250 [Actinobacteria bacterium]|nr:hypothetical protein [Actinomycetota bacterium]